MKYKIIEGDSIVDIVEKVNKSIKEGWKPLGGIVADIEVNGDVSEVYTTGQYLQSMVKE